MKTLISILMIGALGIPALAAAQTFVSKGKIEYEVKTDIKKTMGSTSWEAAIKEKLPQFKTAYYNLIFDGEHSLYKFDHWGKPELPGYMRQGEDEEAYFYDFSSGTFQKRKAVVGTIIGVADSIPKLQWKLVNENRIIAGFNCRKAYTVLFDSVYVFAFYTEEIVAPVGPGGFHGLPGAILGVSIPRLYTSWIATKLEVTNVNTASIKAPQIKKPVTRNQLENLLKDRMSDWYSSDDPDINKEIQESKIRMFWESML